MQRKGSVDMVSALPCFCVYNNNLFALMVLRVYTTGLQLQAVEQFDVCINGVINFSKHYILVSGV